MMELNNNYDFNLHAEALSPDVSLHEVSLQLQPGSRLYSQQDGGAFGLEQLRALQVHLMDLQKAKPFKRVLITSAVGGEGKTHVAANLSLSLAAEGLRRVLVIDADVRKPSLHLAFGIPNLFGFKDCLENEDKCWKAVQKVKDFELYLMTGGIDSCSSIGPAHIASVQALLEKLEPYFDLIILDSPPLLGGIDGKLLSNVADSILLVVGSGKAPRSLVVQAQQSVQRDKVLGVILNRLDPAMPCFRSYYAYGTGSAEGQNHTRSRSKKEFRRRDARTKGLVPESDVRRELKITPIIPQEDATPEPRETHRSLQDVSPVEREPKIGARERRYEPVSAAQSATSILQDLPEDAAKFEAESPQVEAPEREYAELAGPEAPAAQQERRQTQGYFMSVLLLAILTLAGILGWAIGQKGAKSYYHQITSAKEFTPVQPATPVKSDAVASAPTTTTALVTSPPSPQQIAASSVPAPAPAKLAGPEVSASDDKAAVHDSQSQASHSAASSAGKPPVAVSSATTTLRIPSGIARQYLTSEVAPEYPEPAREQHIEGPVVLNVQVDKHGRVQKLTTISGNPILVAAATNGIQRWRFRPFYHNGQAEEFETQVTVNFKLP